MKQLNQNKTLSTLSRLLCLLLVGMMLLGLVACAGGDNPTDPVETTAAGEQTGDPSETTKEKEETTSLYVDDKVPDLNLKKTITILYWEDREHEEFISDGETGDAVLDALYKRNLSVTRRLGIEFDYQTCAGNADNINTWVNHVGNDLKAGPTFDIMAGYSLSTAAAAQQGFCMDLLNDEITTYLTVADENSAWWPRDLIERATINDKLYFCSGDISANTLYMMYTCFVNTDLLEQYHLQNPQELVPSGKWTYDKFFEMCAGVYIDDDGIEGKSVGDQFGYMTSGIHVDPWFYGTGVNIIDNVDGEPVINNDFYTGNKLLDTIDRLNTLLWASNDGLYTSKVQHQIEFNNGNLLFAMDRCRITITRFESTDLHFVVVPSPKYSEEQEKYYTTLGNPFTLYAVPKGCKVLEEVGATLEVMASESYRQVTPALFEITLKYKKVNDETSGAMYDIVREGLVFDIGRIFNSLFGMQGAFRGQISGNSNTWSSFIGSQKRALNSSLNKLLDSFDD